MRILTGETLSGEEVRRWAVAAPLVPTAGRAGLAARIEPPPGGSFRAGCWRFELGRGRGGTACATAAAIVAQWTERIARPGLESVLLGPLERSTAGPEGGAETLGLEARDGTLRICVSRPTPDLPERLAHPVLWFEGVVGTRGPGPFSDQTEDRFGPNPDGRSPRPRLDWLRTVDEGGHDPALLLRLGEADAGLVYGASASTLIDGGAANLRVEPWERMDRVYVIRFHPERRWVQDPTFRRWFTDRLPRESVLRYVLDGRGEIRYTLSAHQTARPPWDALSRRPFSSTSHPSVSLDYPGGDGLARAIAERVKATFELEGVSISIRARPPEALQNDGLDGSSSMAVLSYRPLSEDPVLALLALVGRLGPAAEPVRRMLERASALETPTARTDAAWLAEEVLLREAYIAPMVRARAFWIVDTGLVAPPVAGSVPRLDLARWRR